MLFIYCDNCGSKISDESKFCSECGTKINQDNTEKDNKIDEKASPKWENCPRCDSNRTEHTGKFKEGLLASIGMGFLLLAVSLFIFPPFSYVGLFLILFSPVAGLVNNSTSEFKCKDCGARWDSDSEGMSFIGLMLVFFAIAGSAYLFLNVI